MSSILIQGWTIHKSGDEYYLNYYHWVYLKEILKYYDDICLLSFISIMKDNSDELMEIGTFKNVSVHPLYYDQDLTYIGSIKHFPKIFRTFKSLRKFDVAYARYPGPFSWLQKVFMNKSKRIIHFVGSPVDALMKNPNIFIFKKIFLALCFFPEHLMHLWACKGAKIFTN